MENREVYKKTLLRKILWFMMVGTLIMFWVGQICMPRENFKDDTTFHAMQADWVQVLPDGSEMPVVIPGKCEVAYGEWGTIKTILPQDLENIWICVRSMQQEMKFFVGDELRKEYSTLDIQKVGKTSTMTYVLVPLYSEDAGEELRVEFMSKSQYYNYVSDFYAGDKNDIRSHFWEVYGAGFVISAVLFIAGLTVVFGSILIRRYYHREVDLGHLGNVVMICSAWLMAESKLRQFVFPNTTVAMWMGYLMIALLPYPFASYTNSVQKGRYRKVYTIIEFMTAINFAVVVILQALNIRDVMETLINSHLIIVILILTMLITLIRDVVKGYIKEYKEVAIGFVIAVVGGICELGLVYVVDAQLNGIGLCLGLIGLLFMAVFKTVRDLIAIEKEKRLAVAASESKAKFLANMSHEIRTPINVVIGMNEMILRENKDQEIGEYAQNIKNASRMLLSLINDVLDFSKIEAGKLEIVPNEYPTASIITDVLLGAEVRAKQKQKQLQIISEIDESLPAVLYGDDIRIKQVLNNLLSNAVKYTENGSVTFSAERLDGDDGFSLRFHVKDTGIGIRNEDMEKLFGSFERLELSKNRYIQGTGLGLNIAKQLVTAMGGTIDVQSKYGIGTCFTVVIPQQIVDNTPMNEKPRAVAVSETATEEKKHFYAPDAKVLAVDDNKLNLKVIQALMKRSAVQLDLANGGEECLQMTKDKKYDLILMDHMMPEPDGIQTLHMLKDDKTNINCDTKVIVLTANAIEGMHEEYLKEGFEDYLSKPVEVDKLESVLAKYIG